MTRIHWLPPAALAVACAGAGDAHRAESMATDSAVLAGSAGQPAEARVSSVMIGRRIGAGNRIIEPTFEFAPADTVHLSVSTSGGGGDRELTAAWRAQGGEIVRQTSQAVASGGENTAFQLAQPKGLKPGTYKVVLFHGEDSVDTKVFVVRK